LAVFLNRPKNTITSFVLRAEATIRSAQCLVALRRWKLEHAQPPKDIETLVKAAGMTSVPIDPWSGEPLRLTVLSGEPVIYSVGDDGKDDKLSHRRPERGGLFACHDTEENSSAHEFY
jgi:hypothetical protein